LRSALIRLLQVLALYAPGAGSVRVWLHRRRGVQIGRNVFIGTDSILETSRPELISIGNDVTISVRTTIIGHFRGKTPADRGEGEARFSVRIEDEAFIGPGTIVLDGVTIGRGAVVAAGSVVNSSVAPGIVVQGNPARPVAKAGVPLLQDTPWGEYLRHVEPIGRPRRAK
jgi:acetyltransferase-like isoleucine patch superfamily enzyme